MLTTERLAALTAVKDGTVKVRKVSAPGNPWRFEPAEQTVALGFLLKAELITVTAEHGPGRRRPSTVTVTGRGWRVLRASS
jgi:DNA-binding PadR family transcriptional regulator